MEARVARRAASATRREARPEPASRPAPPTGWWRRP